MLLFRFFVILKDFSFRNIVLEFGARVLGVMEEDLMETVAYRQFLLDQEAEVDAKLLFQSRVLSYASATWKKHASTIRPFLSYCAEKAIPFFNCPSSHLNDFQLRLARDGASLQTVEATVSAISFIYRFFLMPNSIEDKTVQDVSRFLRKVCRKPVNKKAAFGSKEVKIVWNFIETKKGGLCNLTLAEFRTFVMAVFQHKTFARFSDVKVIQLRHVFYDLDFFKILIPVSKTDQAGSGAWVYLTRSVGGARCAHRLLCLYLNVFHRHSDASAYLFPPIE